MINLRLSVEGGNEMSELKIPAGISEIRKDGYYYIDKSGLIRELLGTGAAGTFWKNTGNEHAGSTF